VTDPDNAASHLTDAVPALAAAQREMKGVTVGEIDTRYRELGGTLDERRRRRKASGQRPPCITLLAPEFVDSEEPEDGFGPDQPARVAPWASFVLIVQ
jgi:hypothetical protein